MTLVRQEGIGLGLHLRSCSSNGYVDSCELFRKGFEPKQFSLAFFLTAFQGRAVKREEVMLSRPSFVALAFHGVKETRHPVPSRYHPPIESVECVSVHTTRDVSCAARGGQTNTFGPPQIRCVREGVKGCTMRYRVAKADSCCAVGYMVCFSPNLQPSVCAREVPRRCAIACVCVCTTWELTQTLSVLKF